MRVVSNDAVIFHVSRVLGAAASALVLTIEMAWERGKAMAVSVLIVDVSLWGGFSS